MGFIHILFVFILVFRNYFFLCDSYFIPYFLFILNNIVRNNTHDIALLSNHPPVSLLPQAFETQCEMSKSPGAATSKEDLSALHTSKVNNPCSLSVVYLEIQNSVGTWPAEGPAPCSLVKFRGGRVLPGCRLCQVFSFSLVCFFSACVHFYIATCGSVGGSIMERWLFTRGTPAEAAARRTGRK